MLFRSVSFFLVVLRKLWWDKFFFDFFFFVVYGFAVLSERRGDDNEEFLVFVTFEWFLIELNLFNLVLITVYFNFYSVFILVETLVFRSNYRWCFEYGMRTVTLECRFDIRKRKTFRWVKFTYFLVFEALSIEVICKIFNVPAYLTYKTSIQ